MKNKIYFVAFVLFFSLNAVATELVCEGSQARDPGQKPVFVNCKDRKAVIDMLGSAWRTLRQQGIGGSMEDMCWSPFNKAKEIHPSIDMQGIAPTFFMQCNMALQYVK